MKKRSTGVSAEKQVLRRRSRSRCRDRGKVSFPLSSTAVSLEEAEQEERSSYPPLFLVNRKYTRAAITATPARTPITMPAIAPGGRPELGCVESPVMERREKKEWRWHYFTVGGPLGDNSQHVVVSTCFFKEYIFCGKFGVRWLADFVLQLFSLTGFLGWWSDLPQFHPGLSALWYFWRLWKCKKGWLLFFYNFPPFHCFMFFCVPAVAATNMPLRSLVVRTSDGRPGERILNSPSPLDRDHTSHRLPAGIWNKPNSVRNRFPLKGDLSSRTPPPPPHQPCRQTPL